MKIVCLTEDSPAMRFTVNSLHQQHGVALVVLEHTRRKRFVRDMKRFGLLETLHRVLLVARRILPRGHDVAVCNEAFGDNWRTVDWDIPRLHTDDINSAEVCAAIADLKPDVVVCQGTTLVRDKTIAQVPCPLNIHAGLSPYYRGSRCTEWALAVGDTSNIGVTVHRLTEDIDGGAVLGQVRVPVLPDDDVFSINARITAVGTRVVGDALTLMKQGAALSFRPQRADQGLLLYRRQFTRHLGRHVKALLRRGELRHMLKHPSAAPYPLLAPWPPPADEIEPRISA